MSGGDPADGAADTPAGVPRARGAVPGRRWSDAEGVKKVCEVDGGTPKRLSDAHRLP